MAIFSLSTKGIILEQDQAHHGEMHQRHRTRGCRFCQKNHWLNIHASVFARSCDSAKQMMLFSYAVVICCCSPGVLRANS